MSKPKNRSGKKYRLMWVNDGNFIANYNLPATPEKMLQANFGFFEGTPVDAVIATVGRCAGFTTDYPTKVKGMEFIVDRLNSKTLIGSVFLWRHAEAIRQLFDAGYDPIELQVQEAKRLGIDFYLQQRMNDWHHTGPNQLPNLLSSRFYDDHPEYRIGSEGAKGWPEYLAEKLQWFQDYSHPEVRKLRLAVTAEACERYDINGFEYDFMRCPGFFRHGDEKENAYLMTELIRETRKILDTIGANKNKSLALSVRVPNTISGALNLGLDVSSWVKENLVDIIIPSTFFNADTEENISEWVELASQTSVCVNPAIEEAYLAGHTGRIVRCFYKPPIMLPLTDEMINAIAAKHWHNGADGLYLFNFASTTATYNYDNRSVLDNIGNPLRLRYKNKRYVVMRTDKSFPNCLPDSRQLPVKLDYNDNTIEIEIADDLSEAATRLTNVKLLINVINLSILDKIEVRFNSNILKCINPTAPQSYDAPGTPAIKSDWLKFDLSKTLPQNGKNEISIRIIERNPRLENEIDIEISDIELEIGYDYPNGPWPPQRK